MNVFIGVVALICCTYIGFVFSKKYSKRKKFFYEFSEFNKKIKNEIIYSQNTIYFILKNANQGNSDFYNCLNEVILEKNDFVFNENYLDTEEIDFYKNYTANIGGGDKLSQIKFVESAYEYLSEKHKNSLEDEIKYKKLYVKLGFLIGLIILIVLI